MTGMTDNWKQSVDEDGASCEYNIFTGDVRYPIDEGAELTQEEIDALVKECNSKPRSLADTDKCPDCKGTGEYRGLEVVENCETCEGLGQI